MAQNSVPQPRRKAAQALNQLGRGQDEMGKSEKSRWHSTRKSGDPFLSVGKSTGDTQIICLWGGDPGPSAKIYGLAPWLRHLVSNYIHLN